MFSTFLHDFLSQDVDQDHLMCLFLGSQDIQQEGPRFV